LRTVVTGGAGFIGSHLVERLVHTGHDVHVIDNLHTGRKENLSGSGEASFSFHQGPAGDISTFGLKGVETVFHLGIYSSSPMYRQDPTLVAKVVQDAIGIYEFAKREGCRLVVASTSSIYNGNPVPWSESAPIHVTDYYTEARYAVERLGELYHKLYGVGSTHLRLFSVYGEREEGKGRYANTLTQFLWSAMRGSQPVLYGDGNQSRDLTYVGDVVDAFLLASQSQSQSQREEGGYAVFNVGTGRATSFNAMVKLIGEKLGIRAEPKYVPLDTTNYVMHTLADTAKAKEALGFQAKVTLEQGLERMIAYYGGVVKSLPKLEG